MLPSILCIPVCCAQHYEEFRKKDSQIRIIIATESLDLGVDLNNVEIVVQYSLPRDISLAMV